MTALPVPKFDLIETKPDVVPNDDMALPTLVAVQLGLKRCEWCGRKGDLNVFTSQYKNPMTGKDEPTMLIVNAREPRTQHAHIFLSQLYQVLVPGVMAEVAPQIAKKLYGFITQQDLFRVSDVIYDFAEDLLSAKPARRVGSQEWLQSLATDGVKIKVNDKPIN